MLATWAEPGDLEACMRQGLTHTCGTSCARAVRMSLPDDNPLQGNHRFRKIKNLGTGHFGKVILAKDLGDGSQVAIKFLPRGPAINHNVEREICNHRRLQHHHIIQFKGVLLTDEYLGIVLEYAPGGDLLEWIKQRKGVNEDLGRWFFQQLIMGLDYIHTIGVVNRDIKLENILVTEGDRPLLKICDFGYSKNVQASAAKSKVGTLSYLAPEVLETETGSSYDGVMSDIWSSGVSLYIMLLGVPPFEKPDENGRTASIHTVFMRVMTGEFDIPPGVISSECEDLIRKMVVKDPAKRLTLKEIQMHPWYLKNLPEGALTFNEQCLEFSGEIEGDQPLEDISLILAAARNSEE